MIKFKYINFLFIFILLCSLILPDCCFAVEQPDIDAAAAILVEVDTGEILYAKNEFTKMYPASTTKMMTALLAIKACEEGKASLSDVVTASENANAGLTWDSSTMNIQPGEQMTLENLLYCALVPSANEACNIIAEYIGGTIENFISMMNSYAEELGCTGTHYNNVHGMPDDNHYTTAYDLYLIALEAMKHESFVRICNTTSIEIPATNMSDVRYLITTNYLISPDEPNYSYQYAVGIKTGSTDSAGFCLVSSARKDGINLISIVLGAEALPLGDGSYEIMSFTETKALFEWAFSNFSYREILSSTELTAEVPVAMGEGMDSVIIHPATSLTEFLPNDIDIDSFERTVTVYGLGDGAEELVAPIIAGEELGEIVIHYDGQTFGPISLLANTDVPLSKAEYMKARIKDTLNQSWLKWTLFGIVFIFILYIAFVIRYNILRARHKKRRRQAYDAGIISTIDRDKRR